MLCSVTVVIQGRVNNSYFNMSVIQFVVYKCIVHFLPPQNIFLGEDIRKQLPRESADFDDVNAKWKVIMTRLNKDRNALRGTHHEGTRRTHPVFTWINQACKINRFMQICGCLMSMTEHLQIYLSVANDTYLTV